MGIYCCGSVYFGECFGNSYLLKTVPKIKTLNNFSARTNIAKFIYLDLI
jgi:phage FluMu protein Com